MLKKCCVDELVSKCVQELVTSDSGASSTSDVIEYIKFVATANELSPMDTLRLVNDVFKVHDDSDRVSMFYSVSEEQAEKDGVNIENVKLPRRATSGSAGYDFYAPEAFELKPGEEIKIPTGVRCAILEGWYLGIYPRSGLGFKYRCGLANTVGIIDSDYYFSDNEGHIMVKVVNNGNKVIKVGAGEAFCQGIFQRYGLVAYDDEKAVRNGGFGSTTNK